MRKILQNLLLKIGLGLETIGTSMLSISAFGIFIAPTLPIRPNWTTTITQVPNPQLPVIDSLWGGWNTTESIPNFGMLIYQGISVYPNAVGQIALVILFAIPFVMMWIAGMDITLPAIMGLMFSLYIALKVPEQYMFFAWGAIVISLAALAFSLYKRLG
jgi:hypothetical protein